MIRFNIDDEVIEDANISFDCNYLNKLNSYLDSLIQSRK